ncbi:MAG: AbiH family protein [Bacteroidales bacterium]|nr:AbiH family protein [Bacteroidales bacterium]
MNRIIIVGNGFDLAHGVKTSYKDFIEWYFGKVIEKLKTKKVELEVQKEKNENKCGVCIYEDKLLNIYWGGSCNSAINVIDNIIDRVKKEGNIVVIRNEYDILKKDYSPLFERIIKDVENKGWVDIEMDYYELLKDYALNKRGNVKQLNEELSYIEKKLIEYLKEVENGYFSPNPIIKTFGEEINKMIYEGIAPRDLSIKYHRSSRNRERDKQDKVVLLNFNYTKIADQYFGNENADFFVIHIHGKLDDEGSVIFGYGDELDKKYKEIEELNDNEYLEKVKSVKYLERDNYRKMQAFIESEPFQVYVMGHSCGNSDRTLLNKIFEHENCVSIKPFYYAYKDKEGNDRDNYTEIVRNITRNFNDKQLLRERVVNKTYCKPLPQSEIKHG